MNNTIDYYNAKAADYCKDTFNADVLELQSVFLSYLKPGALILDFGCGSGRDSKAFLKQGFRVEATDGSGEMCRLASTNTGLKVKQMLFQDLSAEGRYDGIWACASILHLPKDELIYVLGRMAKALKNDGIAYLSFKYGTFEGMHGERYFIYLDEQGLADVISNIESLTVVKTWITGDVRPGRDEERWLNAIVRKTHG